MADTIQHNVRVIQIVTGEHVICNFTQVLEPGPEGGEERFVAYQLLYPLKLSLSQDGDEYRVSYTRWNPYTPYEDHRIAPQSVISAMPPAGEILQNYVTKLKESGVDLAFLPNNGDDILGKTTESAVTEGPVAASAS